MLPTLISKIQQGLVDKTFLRLESLSNIIPQRTMGHILRQFMINVQSSQVNFEIVCFLAIEKERKLLINYDKWSNVTKGFIINEMENISQRIEFEKKQVKEFKIIGFLKNEYPLSLIKEQLKISTSHKKFKYVNSQLLSLKKGINQKIGKETQGQEFKYKTKEPQKTQKIDNNSSKQKIELSKLKPLQKRPIQDLNNQKEKNTPNKNVATNTESQATKENNKTKLKMNIQSDQEYYQKKQFRKLMDLEQGKETDCSGKKKEEPQAKQNKKAHIHMSKFIEDDDEDEEEALFAKMQKVAKKGQIIKEQFGKNQLKIKPQATKKDQKKSKKGDVGLAFTQKGGLMGWLSKK